MPKKGTILVHNGNKLVGIEPDGEGKVIIFDSNTESGVRWQNSSKKSDKIIMNTKDASNDSSYTKMAEFFFTKNEYQSIDTVKILSYMDPSIDDYQIRLYDSTYNKTIFEITLKYTKPTIETIDKFDYQPEGDCILEIQTKINKTNKSKNKYVYLIDTTINYTI